LLGIDAGVFCNHCQVRQYELPQPFFVLATQNPIEQEGTYPLPEAQLDRFMFNIFLDYPSISARN
jgi:MoxR-like ATPase